MSEVPPSDFAYERLSVNSLLAGRYRLVRYLGEGAAGSVYFAHDLLLDNRAVAVKVLHASLANHGAALERLRREVEITQGLTHPSVVQVYAFEPVEVGEDHRPTALLVMEYVEGSTLRSILDQGALREDEALALFYQLIDVLAFIHDRGIIHRDIKPENIIITSGGGVKLTDFGLAKHDAPMDLLTQSGQVLGTPGYMAPELYCGAAATPASDVYSLGLILYEMLYGEQLQRSEKLIARSNARESSRIKRKLRWLNTKNGLVALILNECCALEVTARPSSASVLKQQLNEPRHLSLLVRRYSLGRRAARLGRSALRVALPLVIVAGVALLIFGRLVSPYSMEHLYLATLLDRVQVGFTGGWLGMAPLDGTDYIRERTAYGRQNTQRAMRLGEEGRRAMLICGIEHRLPEFQRKLPPGFDDLGVPLTESCASYPLTERPKGGLLLTSPLAVVARIGDRELFDELLTKVPNGRISEDVIEHTYLHAVRMNRATFVEKLIARGLLPKQVSDELLIEVLMAPSEQIFDQLLATGRPFTLTLQYVTERVTKDENPNRPRWRKNLVKRHLTAARRLATLRARGHDFGEIRAKLTSAERVAIATRHHDLTAILIPLGIDWNVKAENGVALVLLAMNNRNNPATELLIAQPEIDLAVSTPIGMTPLAFAVGSHRPTWIRALQARGVDMNHPIILRQGQTPTTPLRLLVRGNFIKTVEALLQDPRIDVNQPPGPDGTTLGMSIAVPSTKMMELLLAHGADVASKDHVGHSALHVAALTATNRHLQLLLAHGAAVNALTPDRETPLMLAARRANDTELAAIFRTLVDAGADPFARSVTGQTAFEYAITFRHRRAIGALLDATGFDPFMPLPSGKLLLELAQGSASATTEILKRAKVAGLMGMLDFHVKCALGYSGAIPSLRRTLPPLEHATRYRDLDTVKLLLAKGADPLAGEGGVTPLALAIQIQDRAIIQALLQHLPSGRDGVALTPALRAAAQLGDLESIDRLLALGADPRHLDQDGNIPLLAAYSSGRRAVIERLRRAAPDSVILSRGRPLSPHDLENIFGVPD